MENKYNISQYNIRKEIFWNCEYASLNYIDNKDIIIKRIIQYGNEKEEIIMWKLYTFEEIKNVAINIDNLDRDRLRYMAFVLNIKEEMFKCYKNKQFLQD